MAKKIIILDKIAGERPSYRVAFWADVPSARQSFYAGASLTSAWGDASVAENTALQAGSVVERVETFSADPPKSKSQIKVFLEARWMAFQAEIDAANPWNFYGSFWDGTTWTDGGVL